jgi:hypothetical protein
MGNVRERKSTQQATYVTAAATNVLSSHSYMAFIMDRSCHFLPLRVAHTYSIPGVAQTFLYTQKFCITLSTNNYL